MNPVTSSLNCTVKGIGLKLVGLVTPDVIVILGGTDGMTETGSLKSLSCPT